MYPEALSNLIKELWRLAGRKVSMKNQYKSEFYYEKSKIEFDHII